MWCIHCGASIPEQSLFCSDCGTAISVTEENETIIEGSERKEDQPEFICNRYQTHCPSGTVYCPKCGTKLVSKSGKQAGALLVLHDFFEFVKSYFSNPVEAMMTTTKKFSKWVVLIIAGIYAMTTSLALYVAIACGSSFFKGALRTAFGYSGYSFSLNLPVFICILVGILLAAASVMIYATAYYLLSKYLGKPCRFPNVIMICVNGTVPVTAILLLSVVMFPLSLRLGLFFVLISRIVWYIWGIASVYAIAPVQKSGKFLKGYTAIILAALIVNGFVSFQLSWSAVQQIQLTYAGNQKTIHQMMKSKNMIGFGRFAETIIGHAVR